MVIYKHEMKLNYKSLFIWTLTVGILCAGCILLYTSLEESMEGIADSFANMGSMSAALGMDKMSLATMRGYYATEIAMMHGLGGAMFAAILGSSLLSKEEAGHTSEFLNVLPVGRSSVVLSKYMALVSNIVIFNVVCVLMYLLAFACMGESMDTKEMVLYHLAVGFMQIEIGSICFMISAFVRRNLIGAGLGIAVVMFAVDMMCRIIPAIENLKYITPFYYSNAADIFTKGEVDSVMLIIGVGITIVSFVVALIWYQKKDLAS